MISPQGAADNPQCTTCGTSMNKVFSTRIPDLSSGAIALLADLHILAKRYPHGVVQERGFTMRQSPQARSGHAAHGMLAMGAKHEPARSRQNLRRIQIKKWFSNAREVLATLHREDSGQDLIEYALVAALIALAATAGVSTVATALNDAFSSIGAKLKSYA